MSLYMLQLIKMMEYFKFSGGKKRMFRKIKKILNWEFFLFVFANLAILINIFFLLEVFTINIIISNDIPINIPIGNIDIFVFLLLLTSLFIIIKYLYLPITILIIQNWSKKEEIKNWIAEIAQNYKLQGLILLVAIMADISSSFVLYIVHRYYMLIYSDTFYDELLLNLIIFGGLTGSYLTIFLFLFIQKKTTGFKQGMQKEFFKNIENKLRKILLFDLSK